MHQNCNSNHLRRAACAQVMALVAHLMEEKSNFGPHLIVVPNAVLVNWKAELNVWLPGARALLGNKAPVCDM
jgi:SNF2 family DNA or RNA helicase